MSNQNNTVNCPPITTLDEERIAYQPFIPFRHAPDPFVNIPEWFNTYRENRVFSNYDPEEPVNPEKIMISNKCSTCDMCSTPDHTLTP